jgi:predicted N-acetyltransferase YhbS
MQKHLTDMIVRLANADDAADVAEAGEAAFATVRSVYRPTREAVARQAERANEGTRLVAEIGGRVVGTVQFDLHDEHIHLMGLAVRPEFRRRGVARRLIEWVTAHAPSLSRDVVALDTIRETGNVPVFERLGFRVVGETVARWCESDRFAELHDVKMERKVPVLGAMSTLAANTPGNPTPR